MDLQKKTATEETAPIPSEAKREERKENLDVPVKGTSETSSSSAIDKSLETSSSSAKSILVKTEEPQLVTTIPWTAREELSSAISIWREGEDLVLIFDNNRRFLSVEISREKEKS